MGARALLAGYAADITFGDPQHHHPVAGFGRLALALEHRFYLPTRWRGALLTAALVLGAATVAEFAARRLPRGVVTAALTWAALGGRSLRREATGVELLLSAGRLEAARHSLRALCGRDASALEAPGIRAGVIESVAENSSDAVVAPLFWAALLGPAGAAGYRAANTLDAIWGHHSERYEDFGWAAARLDDLLNWLPARLTAWLACGASPLLGGAPAVARATIAHDAGAHPSPNAGVVEAAFAGALGLRLGGPLAYAGRSEARPWLGNGREPGRGDVARAARLSRIVCATAAVLCAGAATLRTALPTRGGKPALTAAFPPAVGEARSEVPA